MHPIAERTVRKCEIPSIFCPGCGAGTILNALLRIVDRMGQDNFIFTSGSGCNGFIPLVIDADEFHTMHGRPVVVATGIKLCRPDKNVVVISGDGDCMGIGGNHFIHAARRNIDITVVMVNNYTYGMTGGQLSPSSPHNLKTKTSPYGNPEHPFDAVNLAVGAGATFAARETVTNPRALIKTLEAAIRHKGFSFIDVISQCPTQVGRAMFGTADASVIFSMIKERAVRDLRKELNPGQFRVGILHEDNMTPPFVPSSL